MVGRRGLPAACPTLHFHQTNKLASRTFAGELVAGFACQGENSGSEFYGDVENLTDVPVNPFADCPDLVYNTPDPLIDAMNLFRLEQHGSTATSQSTQWHHTSNDAGTAR